MPSHANEEAAVVAPVGGPPRLGVGHQGGQVTLEAGIIELAKLLGVVEVGPKRIGGRRVLVEDGEIELIGPPVAVAGAPTGGTTPLGREGALADGAHRLPLGVLQLVASNWCCPQLGDIH